MAAESDHQVLDLPQDIRVGLAYVIESLLKDACVVGGMGGRHGWGHGWGAWVGSMGEHHHHCCVIEHRVRLAHAHIA